MKKYIKKDDFIFLNINGYEHFFEKIVTIYQALLEKSWYIPRFCYHSKLLLAGNCRMCFVEVKSISKPLIACSTLISNDMVISTSSSLAYKARENILEFLLINHPIDCPICDKGSECDLQDQYIVMGSLASRYYESSRKSVGNKNVSFLIKLSLSKCINCTRCTRFSQNVTGEYTFSLLNRGENSVISNYINYFYLGEIIGNVMDLCPVGALTSKIISYDFRVWELVDIKFVDFTDVFMPPIRIDYRGLKVIRILPLTNELIQEEWISDKLRYNFKTLFKNRFYKPYIKKNHDFINISWKNINMFLRNKYLNLLNFFVKKNKILSKNLILNSETTDIYIFIFLKKYFNKLNFFEKNVLKKELKNTFRNNFMIYENDLDFLKIENFIFLNFNIRFEIPLLNFKIREKMNFDYSNIFSFSSILELNYIYEHYNSSVLNLLNFFKSDFKYFEKKDTLLFYSNVKNNNVFSKIINCLDVIKFQINCNSCLDIINNEFNNFKNKYTGVFNNFLNINFENIDIKNNNDFFSNKLPNLFFSQNAYNLNYYNILFPKKFNFEQNSMFLNIFGLYNDFTYLLYKVDLKSLKNDWNVAERLFLALTKKRNKIKLSFMRKKFIPIKFKYTEYKILVYKYFNSFNKDAKVFINTKEYFYLKKLTFYDDVFSKNNSLFDYFKELKRKSTFMFYININSIHWIF